MTNGRVKSRTKSQKINQMTFAKEEPRTKNKKMNSMTIGKEAKKTSTNRNFLRLKDSSEDHGIVSFNKQDGR